MEYSGYDDVVSSDDSQTSTSLSEPIAGEPEREQAPYITSSDAKSSLSAAAATLDLLSAKFRQFNLESDLILTSLR